MIDASQLERRGGVDPITNHNTNSWRHWFVLHRRYNFHGWYCLRQPWSKMWTVLA